MPIWNTENKLSDLIETWIQNKLQAGELGEHGAKYYRAYLRRLLKGMDLTPEQVLLKAKADINQVWTDAKNTNGMTAAGRHKALLAFRNFLRANGFYPPQDRLSHQKSREERAAHRKGFLSWEEAQAVANAAGKPYNLVFELMLHSAWGCSEFLEFNKAETWKQVKDYLARNPTAEYYRFDFAGRKNNDQPFYSLIPTAVLREIFASEITLPISTIKGLPLDHERYNVAVVYLESSFNTALKRAPIPPPKARVTLHDLRDCFRTRCTLQKISFEASEFALGHILDQKGYIQCYNDEPWMWGELRQVYGPAMASGEEVKTLKEEVAQLRLAVRMLQATSGFIVSDEKGHPFVPSERKETPKDKKA
jgi:integrase